MLICENHRAWDRFIGKKHSKIFLYFIMVEGWGGATFWANQNGAVLHRGNQHTLYFWWPCCHCVSTLFYLSTKFTLFPNPICQSLIINGGLNLNLKVRFFFFLSFPFTAKKSLKSRLLGVEMLNMRECRVFGTFLLVLVTNYIVYHT